MLQHFSCNLSLSRIMFWYYRKQVSTLRNFTLLKKDMNDYCSERSNKMSLQILRLINHYIIYDVDYLCKQLNVYTILQSNIV